MDPVDARSRLSDLSAELAVKYGIGGSLARQAKKIGRAMPRYERRHLADLARVEAALTHPKLQRQIDGPAFERAETALQMHLEGVDAADRRKGIALDITTTVMVNLLLAGITLAVLWTLLR